MRTTVLFGAGAAQEFYTPSLTGATLNAALRRESAWLEAVERHSAIKQGANRIEPRELWGVIKALFDAFPSSDFETMIALIDRVASFEHTGDSTASGRFLLHDLLSFYGARRKSHSTVWLDVPFLAREILADAIVRHPRHPRYVERCELQRSFLGDLAHRGATRVYTLNYDESLSDSLPSSTLETGFAEERFDVGRFHGATHSISWLHGSVRFVAMDGGFAMASGGSEASKRRQEGLAPGRHPSTVTWREAALDKSFDTFLVMGRLKELALDHEPYAAYYHRLATDLASSDLLVIAGYSFGDNHLNRFIAHFSDLDPTRREILLVDYDAKPLDVSTRGDWHPGTKLFKSLENTKAGEKRSLTFSRGEAGEFAYKYDAGVRDINEKGFGMLYPGINYVRRGYEWFLQNREAVLGGLRSTRAAGSEVQ